MRYQVVVYCDSDGEIYVSSFYDSLDEAKQRARDEDHWVGAGKVYIVEHNSCDWTAPLKFPVE